MKKILFYLLPILLTFGVVSCTSGNVEKDEGAGEAGVSSLDGSEADGGSDGLIEGEGEGENGDLFAEGGEGEGLSADSPSEFSNDTTTDVGENMADDALADDGFSDDGIAGDTAGVMADNANEENGGETGEDLGYDSPTDISSTPEPGIVSDAGDAASAVPDQADTSASLPNEEPLYSAESSEASEPPPRVNIPLKKIASSPYKKNGILINAVYVARPGDTLQAISEKIYGQDKSAELKTLNSHIGSKKIKTGMKIYYNSPRRPNDEARLLTFYEDNGVSPSIYTSQEGDNIRVVSKKLLGDENSWKEIWATNSDVESKGVLSGGVQLRYWGPDMVVENGALAVADSQSPGTQQMDMGAAPPESQPHSSGMAEMEPPPVPRGGEEIPPPPAPPTDNNMDGDQSYAQNNADQAPPAGMGGLEPPPPPPPPPMPPPGSNSESQDIGGKESNLGGFEGIGEDPNQTMALGVGALLLLASVALFVIVRKKKRRQSLDFNTTTQTQID